MKLAMILWLAHILPQPVADPMCLATTVYLEARGQPELGQQAIAEIALRRRDSGLWGGSVCSVVTAPGQFAMATSNPDRRLLEPAAAFTATRIAVTTLLNWATAATQDRDIVPGANSFALRTADVRGHIVKVIGSHTFYRSNSLAQR